MFSKGGRLGAAVTALALAAGPASAQIQSMGLDDVDAWGTSLLERGEPAFSDRVWSGSDAEYLVSLLGQIDVEALSPPEKAILSRALRSPAASPSGDLIDELMMMRIEMLAALGDMPAATKLARQTDFVPDDFDGDAILSDRRLADGELDVVCMQMNQTAEGAFWAQLRAMCALNAGDMAAAELSIEIAAQQPETSPWFSETAIAVLGDLPDRPAARYGSGVEFALSRVAELEPDDESLAGADPALAAKLAENEELPIEFRVKAANVAALTQHITPARHRELYDALVLGEDFEPSDAIEAALILLAQEPELEDEPVVADVAPEGPRDLRSMNEDWIEPVQPENPDTGSLQAEEVDEVSLLEQQAMALREALRDAASDPQRFTSVARLFGPDLDSLAVEEDSRSGAVAFAAASLMGGREKAAMRWLNGVDAEELSDADAFDVALLKGYALTLATQAPDELMSEIADTLIETAVETDQQASAMRLFAIWSGLEMPVPVMARAALAGSDIEADRIRSGKLAAMQAAVRAGAAGEAVFAGLTETNGQPGSLSGADLAAIISVVNSFDRSNDAARLGLEAGRVWELAAR